MESLLIDARSITELTPDHLRELVDRIGNTPLEPVYFVIEGKVRKVHLKLE
jgi:hypothetical protein